MFTLSVEEPGELEAVVEARYEAVLTAPGIPIEIETAQKGFRALAVTTVRYHAEAPGYQQIEPEGDVEVDLRQGLKELRGVVQAWQITDSGTLELRPLRNASVKIENGGTLQTNADGEYRLEIDRNGSEVESHNFTLLPEDLQVQVYAIPESMLARGDFNGAVGATLGKNLQIGVRAQTGLPVVGTGTLIRGRQFDITVSAGSLGEQLQDAPLAVRYHPPQSVSEPYIRVEVTATDRQIPQLRGTRRFLIYKDAFLLYSKVGFVDVSAPMPVSEGSVSQMPGAVRGIVKERFSGEHLPVADVKVTAIKQNDQTDPFTYANFSGGFRLDLLTPPEPVVVIDEQLMRHDERVFDFYKAVVPIPDRFRLGFNTTSGFESAFPFLTYLREWGQQDDRDRQALRDILSAVSRLEVALPTVQEAYEARQQYGEELIKSLVDIALFFASELKLFEKATESFTVARGWKLNSKLASGALDDAVRQANLGSVFADNPGLREDIVNILKQGMSDANLERAAQRLGDALVPRNDKTINAFREALET